MIHCSVCDKDFDNKEEWMAEYDPDICGRCVQNEKERKAFKFSPLMDWAVGYFT